jgi:hypothetical protein
LRDVIESWLTRFELEPVLVEHCAAVFVSLPEPVREDLMNDPSFTLIHATLGEDGTVSVMVPSPLNKTRMRCVVLKRSLAIRTEGFVRYVIAHELAHAHLNNEGRWPEEDPETAADALAAQWGFPRPRVWG